MAILTKLISNWRILSVLGLGAIHVGGCASDRQVIQQASGYHGSLEPAVIEDAELNAYMQQVGDRILKAARDLHEQKYGPASHFSEDTEWMFSPQMKFHLVSSEVLNAFTTGGEHMYIYTGLVDQCESEDELAAVMSHEYAHVYARHVHKGMNRQYTALGVAAAAGAAGYALGGDNRGEYAAVGAGLGFAAGQFIGMGFTRKDENEADDLGFNFYVRAGWDPDRFGDFFQKMIDKGYDTTPEIASSHPSLSSRVKAAKQRAASLPPEAANWRRPPVADKKKFASIKTKSVQIAKSMPKDETTMAARLLFAAVGNCIVPTDQEEQQQARARLAELQQEQ